MTEGVIGGRKELAVAGGCEQCLEGVDGVQRVCAVAGGSRSWSQGVSGGWRVTGVAEVCCSLHMCRGHLPITLFTRSRWCKDAAPHLQLSYS